MILVDGNASCGTVDLRISKINGGNPESFIHRGEFFFKSNYGVIFLRAYP
jgi:hypothetical protein